IARIRGMTPVEAEINIEELTRKGGEAAVIGLSRLITECVEQAKKCDGAGLHAEAVRYRKLQLDAYREQAKIAALYPGRKTVNNNNLVLGDMAPMFDMIDAVLKPYPEARAALAQAWAQSQQPALEHEA